MRTNNISSKSSRTAGDDFPAKVVAGGYANVKDDDMDWALERPAGHSVRQMRSAAYLRAKERGFVSPPEADLEADLDDWDAVDPDFEAPRRARNKPIDLTFTEKEAQDWINDEQEVQRMMGIGEVGSFYRG